MEADKTELIEILDAFVKRFEEISGAFVVMADALNAIAASHKGIPPVLHSIDGKLSNIVSRMH